MGNKNYFNFSPTNILNEIKVGDLISIDFNSVLVQVINFEDKDAVVRVINGGIIGTNKAVTIQREILLPPMSKKDENAIKISLKHNIHHFALSFANCREDIIKLRKLVGKKIYNIKN